MTFTQNILTCAGLALFASSCASNHSPVTTSGSAPSGLSSSERNIAQQVFNGINAERARNGKKALRGHPALNKLAQKQSDYLASRGDTSTHVAHHGAHNRAQYAYLKHDIENVTEIATSVSGANPSGTAVSQWKNSADHRKHILQSWDVTGVGVSRGSDGKYYIVQAVGAQLVGVPRSIQPIGW
ncbi:MAG: CAP domain-containing protein [Akkermansiaceae bacterium]